MKTYRIAVDYATCGITDIKANSFEEALKKAEHVDTSRVYDKEYIDSSWNVNYQVSEEFCYGDHGEEK